jgi:hypothetical protein
VRNAHRLIDPATMTAVVREVVPLVSDADLHLSHLALQLAAT